MPATALPQLVARAAPREGVEADAEGRYLLVADVVYNGLGTPRADAAVALFSEVDEHGGRSDSIVEYAAREEALERHPASRVLAAGLAISPAPVNAHTHLDLSDMSYGPGSYEAFIAEVMAFGRRGGRGLEPAKRGLAELKDSGVRVVGDIVTDPGVMELLLADRDLEGVAYWEVLGPRAADAEEIFERAAAAVNRFRTLERPGGMRVGISPHTPHTVSAALMKRLTVWAREQRLPVAIHVAETPAEREFQLHGSGPIAEAFGAMGIPVLSGGLSPVRLLDELSALDGAPTLIHGVAVDEDDVRLLQRHGCTVVHCPRSNHALECGRFPWELYARHAVSVAFGTDSRGSSPDLDVTKEVEFAAALHGAKANLGGLVRALVKGGHQALGLTPPVVRRGEGAGALLAWGDSQASIA